MQSLAIFENPFSNSLRGRVIKSGAEIKQGTAERRGGGERSARQILLTTCVGSTEELEEMVLIAGNLCQKVWQAGGSATAGPGRPASGLGGGGLPGFRANLWWAAGAVPALYHFMRCSQLEYVGQDGRTPIQELVYERPYMVLPPVVEWVRVAHAFADHRAAAAIDPDDVLQAARVLLPGMDCPPRPVLDSEPAVPGLDGPAAAGGPGFGVAAGAADEQQCLDSVKRAMAFRLLSTGRRDLVPHALQLLPPGEDLASSVRNAAGLSPLQVAAARGDVGALRTLLDTGARVDGAGRASPADEEGTGGWTPLTYAALAGHTKARREGNKICSKHFRAATTIGY